MISLILNILLEEKIVNFRKSLCQISLLLFKSKTVIWPALLEKISLSEKTEILKASGVLKILEAVS